MGAAMSLSNPISLLSALAGCVLASVLAGCSKPAPLGDIDAGKALAQNGRGTIAACSSCHGSTGEGNFQAGFPRLAGLDAGYLLRQLQDFARELPPSGIAVEPIARDYSKTPRIYSDKTVLTPGVRQDPIMSSVAKQLYVDDMRNIAAYYASLEFEAQPLKADFETLERGQDLALRGKAEYDLPACVSCHAPDGEGFGSDFPPLAGQPPQYLIEQINRWQRGQRDNDPMGLMKAVAEKLTDADKIHVAAYYANRSLVVKAP
jgi:cytochrome c553